MSRLTCSKCNLSMTVVQARAVGGIVTVTVRCVKCGAKKDVNPENIALEKRKGGRLWPRSTTEN